MKNEIILDCESYESTLDSISKIFNLKKQEILDFLGLYNFYTEEELYKTFCKKYKQRNNIDYTCFFHLTRYNYALKEDFCTYGLLSKNKARDLFFENLHESIKNIVSENQFLIDKQKIIDDYGKLTRNSYDTKDDGPYGLLINDTSIISRHFSIKGDGPELVRDMLEHISEKINYKEFYEKKYSIDSLIIKFKAKIPIRKKELKKVLWYIYSVLKGNNWNEYNNLTKDFLRDYNIFISGGDILKVEKLINKN